MENKTNEKQFQFKIKIYFAVNPHESNFDIISVHIPLFET